MVVDCRTIRLECEDHALLDLHRLVERDQAADDWALVKSEAQAVPELEREGLHFVGKAELFGLGPASRDLVSGDTGLDQADRCIDPLAGFLVSVLLGGGGPP